MPRPLDWWYKMPETDEKHEDTACVVIELDDEDEHHTHYRRPKIIEKRLNRKRKVYVPKIS